MFKLVYSMYILKQSFAGPTMLFTNVTSLKLDLYVICYALGAAEECDLKDGEAVRTEVVRSQVAHDIVPAITESL